MDEKSSSFTFFTRKDLGIFREQHRNKRPTLSPVFIQRGVHRSLKEEQAEKAERKGKFGHLRGAESKPLAIGVVLQHRVSHGGRNATSALDSSRSAERF